LAEKITGMLYQILKQCSDAELRNMPGFDITAEEILLSE
jgi:hypothetical protein